ncbi:MAG: hypothetical protein IK990_17540 [Ruminiclostridium sp.]|nr:hypothetical protein [Ruminiclostridium sp.]
MYKCNNCGKTGDTPDRPYDTDGSRYAECAYCGSENIIGSRYVCGVCGKPLFDGESAYEAGELLFCGDCLTEVLV